MLASLPGERQGRRERERESIDMSHTSPRSHLFTIRVWEEEVEAGQTEWRGKVQLLPGGEVHYFREWTTLVPLLLTMLADSEATPDMQPPE